MINLPWSFKRTGQTRAENYSSFCFQTPGFPNEPHIVCAVPKLSLLSKSPIWWRLKCWDSKQAYFPPLSMCRGCFGRCNAKSESHGCDNWKSAHQPDSMSPNTDRGSLSGANNSQRQPSPHLSTDAQYRDLLYWSRTVQRPGVLESQYRELLYWNEPHRT